MNNFNSEKLSPRNVPFANLTTLKYLNNLTIKKDQEI